MLRAHGLGVEIHKPGLRAREVIPGKQDQLPRKPMNGRRNLSSSIYIVLV